VRWVKSIVLLLVWPIFFVIALLIHSGVSVLRLSLRWRWISRLTRCFAVMLRMILNVKITVEGERDRLRSGGCFIVSNHLGYVDGIVLGSMFPVIYVSKKEVRGWPLIGQWTALCGTIFVDRKRKDKIPLLVEEVVTKLRQKANILNFPEGTSTNGERLLPFQPALFAAPLRARATVVPVTLTYRRINDEPLSPSNRDRVYWYGDMEFVGHFWNLLALRTIEVALKIHPAIETSQYKNDSLGRKQLSQACYESISGNAKRIERRRVLA